MFKRIKYDKKEDHARIINDRGEVATNIQKTFKRKLTSSTDELIDFVGAVHDKIEQHNNFMRLYKYGAHEAEQWHEREALKKYAECKHFIPRSREQLKKELMLKMSIDFINKYNVLECVHDKNKQFNFDEKEFIQWYNSSHALIDERLGSSWNHHYDSDNWEDDTSDDDTSDDETSDDETKVKHKNKWVVSKINELLRIHGLELMCSTKQIDTHVFFIKTLIDYQRFGIDINSLDIQTDEPRS
ncbi:unnamed protein product [Sphagnum jensenii]